MSVWAPTKVINDGLIFYYDIGNSKSFAGEPTTNHYSNSDLASGNNVGQEGGSNPTNDVIVFSNPGNSPYCVRSTAVGGSIYTEYQLTVYNTISANTDYTLSCWVAWTPDWDGTYSVFHMRWYNSSGGQAGASGLEQGTTLETRVVNGLTWYRKYYSFNSGASVNGTHDWYVGYYSNNTKGYRYFTNFQLEPKNHATQWSSSTRSNTQGLLDLTGNATLNLSSTSFDSTVTPTFNGTSSYIYVTPSVAFTLYNLDVWIYNDNAIPNNDTVIGGPSTYQTIIQFNEAYPTGINLGAWTGGMTNESVHFWTGTASSYGATYIRDYVAVGWHNLVFNWNGSGYDIWVDGTKRTTYSFSGGLGAAPLQTNVTNMQVGYSSPGYYFNGKIPIVKCYNTQLTDTQVLQNFNATKGRFGL